MTIPFIQFQKPRRDPSLIERALVGALSTAVQQGIRHPFEVMAENRAEERSKSAEGRQWVRNLDLQNRRFARQEQAAEQAFNREAQLRRSLTEEKWNLETLSPTPEQAAILEEQGFPSDRRYTRDFLAEFVGPERPVGEDVYGAAKESGLFSRLFGREGPIPAPEDVSEREMNRFQILDRARTTAQSVRGTTDKPFAVEPTDTQFALWAKTRRKVTRDEDEEITGTEPLSYDEIRDLHALDELESQRNAGVELTPEQEERYQRAKKIETIDISDRISPQVLESAVSKIQDAPSSDRGMQTKLTGWARDLDAYGMLRPYYEARGERVPPDASMWAAEIQENENLSEAMVLIRDFGWVNADVATDPTLDNMYQGLSPQTRAWLQHYWYNSGESSYLFPEARTAIEAGKTGKHSWSTELLGLGALPVERDRPPQPGGVASRGEGEEGQRKPDTSRMGGDITGGGIIGINPRTRREEADVAREEVPPRAEAGMARFIETTEADDPAAFARINSLAQRIAQSEDGPDAGFQRMRELTMQIHESPETFLAWHKKVVDSDEATEKQKEQSSAMLERYEGLSESERERKLRADRSRILNELQQALDAVLR